MNKSVVLASFFCLFSTVAFTQNKIGWEGTSSGDYVIYKDASWKEEAYLGFLYYNASSIGTFLYIPSYSLRVKILFSVEDLNGELVLTGQRILDEQRNDELYILAVNYLMDILPNLYKTKIKPTKKAGIIKKEEKIFNTQQFGNSCTFYYSSYIPFFYLDSISDENGKKVLILQEMGRLKDDSDFFSFEPTKIPRIKWSELALEKNPKKEKKTVEGVTFNLDSQWKQIADNSFFMGGIAFLTISKVDEKQFSDIPKDVISSMVKVFSMSGKNSKVLHEMTELIENKKGIFIKTEHYDVLSEKIIKDIKTVIKRKNEYVVVSLTVDAAYYKWNKSYFDNLF
ncbi:MAG: hypothetical protein ACTTJ3_03690 [Treponema sp.]